MQKMGNNDAAVDRRLAEAYVELYRMVSLWLKYFWFWCESPLLHVSRSP